MVAGRERPDLDRFYRTFSATPGVPNPTAVDEYVRCYAWPGDITSAFARYRGVPREIEHNTRHLNQPLGMPVLAIGGERVFGDAVGENLRHGVIQVEQEVLAGCGHYAPDERPTEVVELLLKFFANAERPGTRSITAS